MKNKLYKQSVALMAALCVNVGIGAQEPTEPTLLQIEPPQESAASTPTRQDILGLSQLTQGNGFKLLGMRNAQALEFTLRRDQVVNSAELDLVFTPSPALLPKLSHLRVYLNDELMGVINVESEFLGQKIARKLPLDPLLMTRFNRIRLEFVGHYTDICEDLTHSALWLDVSKETRVTINQEPLPLANDLAFFPEPFFDAGDMQAQAIPFVFAQAPSNMALQASAILASYFGKEAQWRDLSFPVSFNTLPQRHAVVFATNDARPDFLKSYPAVTEPTVELMAVPNSQTHKMLLILGRDEADLVTAASALAIGNPMFRGRSVSVDSVIEEAPR
ncbi:MAG TPA: cellulose biosynthesis cyclic di-GMP-binding regulatory protein BcsB, partial [Paenalcaligenes hominis]|nr:cellulose biosynthesis cyclic di-GMP-binding regulatory protein BcsB [Paenalcaligenes hominis]